MKRRTSNAQLVARVDALCGKVDSMLHIMGGLLSSMASRAPAGPLPPQASPQVQELLKVMRDGPGLGERPREISDEERERNIKKAQEQADRVLAKVNQAIDAELDKRAQKGVPDDGNALTPQEAMDLEGIPAHP